MRRYAIWDKSSKVITPSKEVFTAEQWASRYPLASEPDSVIILSNSYFNGALCEELHQMKYMCKMQGAVFADNLTDQELLEAIEQFESDLVAAQQAAAEEAAAKEAEYAAASLKAEQDVAGSLAYQNMMNY